MLLTLSQRSVENRKSRLFDQERHEGAFQTWERNVWVLTKQRPNRINENDHAVYARVISHLDKKAKNHRPLHQQLGLGILICDDQLNQHLLTRWRAQSCQHPALINAKIKAERWQIRGIECVWENWSLFVNKKRAGGIIFLVFPLSLLVEHFSSHHTSYLLHLAVAADGQLHQVIHEGL
jgi:hypothetical protein